jgi:hypothetical protein
MKITNQHKISLIIIIALVAAASFFGGMKYQQTRRSVNFRGQITGQGPGGNQTIGNGQRNGFRPVAGDIVSMDEKSITVKMQDGSSKIVLINDKTSINRTSDATKTDLTVGGKVSVFGMDNADGSVTASNIQLNPQMQGNPEGKVPSK